MLRICHITDSLNVGGLERTLVHAVSGLTDFGHCVFCLRTKGALAGELEARGIEVREFGFTDGMSLKDFFYLVSQLKASRADIVHSHGFFPSMWGRPAGVAAGIPRRIVHVQNVYYGITGKPLWKYKLLIPFATRYIAVSQAVRTCLIEYVGVPAAKISVVYNAAVDLAAAPGRRREVRARLGVADTDILVGGLGRLEEHKGFAYLLEAVAACRASGLPVKALLVGDGPDRGPLEEKIARLGLAGQVTLAGMRLDIGDHLSAMDIFVQPSTVREGLPLSLAEAASCGLSLVATDIGGNPEIVAEGANGFIIAPRDVNQLAGKLRALCADPGMRERMGRESSRIWQERFSVEKMIGGLREVYGR